MHQRPLRERAWPYGAWLLFLAAAGAVTYAIDPVVYGFTVLGLGAATVLVALFGLGVCAFAKRPRPWAVAGLSLASAALVVVGLWFAILANWRC